MAPRKQKMPGRGSTPRPRPPAAGRAQQPSRPPAAARPRRRGAPAAPPGRAVQALDRTDLWVAGGVGAAASLLFLWTFSAHVALGDAPESVNGVRSLGILHAPGYVTYVVAARAFSEIVRIGSWETRVNLFSLVCAVLTVAVVYVLARAFGASRPGAAIGSLALATTSSFWFYADFAKYYPFSALLVSVITLCVLMWRQRGHGYLLVIAAVLTGSSIGLSWQLALILTVALVAMLLVGSPRPRPALAIGAALAAIVTLVGVCVYVVVRAHQDPAANYGNATTLGRLVELLKTSDYAGLRQSGGAGVGHFVGSSPVYFAIVGRDIGLGAAALAVAGCVDVVVRRRLDHGLFFALFALGNIAAVGISWGFSQTIGFYTGLVIGGQLVGAFIVVAVLAALGTTWVLHELEEWQADARRERSRFAYAPGRVRVVGAGVIAFAVILPSVIVHHANADHRIPPLADRYALRVLAQLPPHSILLAGGWEFGQPIVERQLVHHDRPDVTVVSADVIAFSWYRDEMVHRLGLDPALVKATSENAVTRFVTALRQKRPVYADTYAMLYGSGLFGYQPEGLVGRVVAGTGPQPTTTFAADAAALARSEKADHITGLTYNRFPNSALYFFYERAHVELAKEYALHNDLDHAADELVRALVFGPKGEDRSPITAAREHQADAKQIILNL